MTVITEDAVGGFRRVTMDNRTVRVRFLPELGAKMTSLVRIASGHEFLLQPQRPLRRPKYGDPFEAFDTSGFDECLPTVSACRSFAKPSSGESISFRFDPMKVPYIGLWTCQGGWPDPAHGGHYTVALEPCSGRPDSLCEAITRGENDLLRPRATKNWTLRLRVQQIAQQG